MYKSIPQPDPWGVLKCEAVGVQKQSVSEHVYCQCWTPRMLRAPPGKALQVLRGDKYTITNSTLLSGHLVNKIGASFTQYS